MRAAVFFCVDDRYFAVAATQAVRALALTGPNVEVHVFVDGAGPDPSLVAKLERRGGGRLRVQVNKLLRHLPSDAPAGHTGSRIVYGRLFAARYIDAERLLYLDVDIGLEGALDIPFELDMRGAAIAAVPDLGLIYEAKRLAQIDDPFAVLPYFNAGVVVFDSARWLARDVDTSLRAWAAQNPDERFADQAFLNAIEEGQWLPLSPRWNCQGPLMQCGLATAVVPRILHFTGWRPWDAPHLPIHLTHEEAFHRRATEAGFGPADFGHLQRRKRSRPLTAQLQRGLYACGLYTPKMRTRRDAFVDRLSFFRDYLRQAEERGFFADPFRLEPTPTIRPIFDGRQYYGVAGEIPCGVSQEART
jgi:lipopolysaccharide biosynthesis glycosyltransferase